MCKKKEVNLVNKGNLLILISILVLLFNPTFSYAKKPSLPLSSCQQLKDQITYYDDLRRRGGSGYEMEYWKKQRRKAKDKFQDNNCNKWKKKIK